MAPSSGCMRGQNNYRSDRKGVEINRRGENHLSANKRKEKLKHKITFADQVKVETEEEKMKLATYLYVESYKQHNMASAPTSGGCCALF